MTLVKIQAKKVLRLKTRKWNQSDLVNLTLTAVVVLGGYAFLRYAYKVTDSTPFTREIVLIILGTVATILITAILLNKQTEVELEKDQSIKFLEVKTGIYQELLNNLENLVLKKEVEDTDLIRMQFITHKLAIFASPGVLEEYDNFLQTFNRMVRDGKFNQVDRSHLLESLSKLTIQIRGDLLGELDQQSNVSFQEIARRIQANAKTSSKAKVAES